MPRTCHQGNPNLKTNVRKIHWTYYLSFLTNVYWEDHAHLRKQTISPPFNFQHLSHTRRKHVPDLATVDEKGLSRVQAQSTQQAPTRHLQGITVEDLSQKLDATGLPRMSTSSRPTTPCLPEPSSGPGHSVSRSVDVTHGREAMTPIQGRPRAASCQTRTPLQRNPSSRSQMVRLSMNNPNIPDSELKPPFATQVQHCSPSEVKYRSQQPLPALPQRDGSKRSSKRMTVDSQLSSTTSGDTASSSASPRSSQCIRPAAAGPWSIRDERGSTAGLSEASWEDDVDFCYEQEAESTCQFNWDEHEEAADGAFRLSKLLPPSDGSRTSALFASAPQNTSPLQRRRSSIVGHRGFQHARTTSVIHEAPDHEMGAQESQDELAPASEESKPMFGPEVMHLGNSIPSISDAASSRTDGSRHVKSNSCGSYESGVRPMAPSSENGHSSVASLSSIPELIHSNTACSSTEAVVPQEPTESTASSKEQQHAMVCDIMRKPSTMSNRALWQAGRVVQGRRPSTLSSKISRMPSAPAQRPLLEGEEETTWI